MNNQEAYNQWASTYNDVFNLTRDLELTAKKSILSSIVFANVLELGCGTGKNTGWLLQKATSVTAVDFSENMLAKARDKIKDPRVSFIQADINLQWKFSSEDYDLITCSLVLEHIENLAPIFKKASKALANRGYFYIGELHPFKQYHGSKARFEKENGTLVLDCYTHHISEFTHLAQNNGFSIVQLDEWFDEENKTGIPRLLTLLLKKN